MKQLEIEQRIVGHFKTKQQQQTTIFFVAKYTIGAINKSTI